MKMEYNTTELGAILALLEVKGLGPVKFKLIYEKLGAFSRIFDLSKEQLKNMFKFRDRHLFNIDIKYIDEIKNNILSEDLKKSFKIKGHPLSDEAKILAMDNKGWKIIDAEKEYILKKSNEKLSIYHDIIKKLYNQKRFLSNFYKKAEEQIKLADCLNASIISFFDSEYPPNLYQSNHSVPLLYVLGDLSVLKNEKCCAVVGTRKPLRWTIEETKKAVKKICAKGFTIVSGLAMGVDETAHRTALENGGKTIAVLGCGVDISYPPKNSTLKKEIEEKGAVVSEYPLGTKVKEFRLKKRNKITVGISKFVLITQTSEKGGTLNAYRAAVEQKKPVGIFCPSKSSKKNFGGNLKILEERKVAVWKFTDGSAVDFGGDTHQGFSF